MAGAASLTTTNLQVFKHLLSLTLIYIHSFGWPIPQPLPLKSHSCVAWGAHSLHLLTLQGPP